MLIKAKPKLAFFDIDGTLIGPSGILSERTKNALSALRSNGVKLAIATGRPKFGAQKICDELEIDCFSLFSSGALISNPNNDQLLFEANIPPVQIEECLKISNELGLYLELYSKDNYYIDKERDVTAKHTSYLGIPPIVGDLNNVIKNISINKLVVISDSPELEVKQSVLIEKMKDLICLCSKGASHPEILFNNITSATAVRSDGFYRIANEVGARSEEILAFGDSISDLIFIELAGLGIAMEEAPEELKNKANIIADKAEHDGVAKIVEQIVAEMR